MMFIRQGATHKVVLGPAVAVGDGFTPVTTLDLSTADEAEVILHDNGTVVDIAAYTFAAITTADGYYHLTLQSGISNTVGHMTVVIHDDSLILPLRQDFTILEEAVYDALFAASATGALPVSSGGIAATAFAAGAIDAAALNADAVTEIQNGLSTAAELAKVPKSDGTATWNATALASLQSEATDALVAYDPPTYTEVLNLFRVALRNDAAVATDLAALITSINADLGSGAGAYDPTEDPTVILANAAHGGASATITADITGDITGNLSGSVGSVTGAVGSVTGSVGSVTGAVGSVTGSVGSVAAGGITASSFAADSITAAKVAADVSAEIADAVWEEILAGHSGTAGSTAEALNAAGAAGDPWVTALPGAYGAGSAGFIVGTILDAAISTRASQTSLNTVDDLIDTEIGTILTHLTDIKGATFSGATDSLEALRNRGDTAWATATGFSTHSAADVWSAATRTITSLDEDSTTLDIDAAVAAAVTTALTTALTEGYRGTGATGSVRDLLYELIAHMGECGISGTTKTLRRLNGSTTAKTYTLNDASAATNITEAT